MVYKEYGHFFMVYEILTEKIIHIAVLTKSSLLGFNPWELTLDSFQEFERITSL
jgi:hypothetical protein